MSEKLLDRAKICVPIVAKNKSEIIKQLNDIIEKDKTKKIDIVEFRADYYDALDNYDILEEILTDIHNKLNLSDIKLLFTIRSEGEGGEKLSFKDPEINDINLYVAENKLSDIIDIELFSDVKKADKVIRLARENGIKIIMSSHDFNKTPSIEEMVERYKAMRERGADIIKLAVMPEDSDDVDKLINAVSIIYNEYTDIHVVGISMGELGVKTRLLGYKYGSCLTFATVGKASAPGQVSVDELY